LPKFIFLRQTCAKNVKINFFLLKSAQVYISILFRMPLVQFANGPLSATGPVREMQLDEMEIDGDQNNGHKSEFIDIRTLVEEKADPRFVTVL